MTVVSFGLIATMEIVKTYRNATTDDCYLHCLMVFVSCTVE